MFDLSPDSLITSGIRVSIDSYFIPRQSNSMQSVFGYEVIIRNESKNSVQLLFRHWDIVDAYGVHSIVEGEGVVGETPVIMPNHYYSYNSGSIFKTPIGKMSGYYIMLDLVTQDSIIVRIPTFILQSPTTLN